MSFGFLRETSNELSCGRPGAADVDVLKFFGICQEIRWKAVAMTVEWNQ